MACSNSTSQLTGPIGPIEGALSWFQTWHKAWAILIIGLNLFFHHTSYHIWPTVRGSRTCANPIWAFNCPIGPIEGALIWFQTWHKDWVILIIGLNLFFHHTSYHIWPMMGEKQDMCQPQWGIQLINWTHWRGFELVSDLAQSLGHFDNRPESVFPSHTLSHLAHGGREAGHVPTPFGHSIAKSDPLKRLWVGFRLGTKSGPF